MIDFDNTVIRFDEERRPYYTARGAKGKFERVYLSDAEQQSYKEHEVEKRDRLNSQAVAPARSFHESGPTGPVGPGPCPVGEIAEQEPDEVDMPMPLELTEVPQSPARTLACRSVTLINSMADLSGALYAFGVIDTNHVGNLTHFIHQQMNNEECGEDSDGGLVSAYAFTNRIAANLYHTYNDERSYSPMFVVAEHVTPVVTLLQYLMGIAFPNGDMAVRAQQQGLMYRKNDDLRSLIEDLQTVYNNIQADLGYAGETFVGEVPAEIGGDLVLTEGLSKIGLVRAADEMVQYLINRVDTLVSMLNAEM
ncbi:hypothetical protein pEaSNUABM22_00074 [Erwinia phage pEa_SNUABM_22]|uniref:Uncharacterized protein n=2 Tax=Alexandravirus TaxID=2733088 RepID=A0AAE8XRE1_9CAUD|nr:hypothetical protein MPK63_gp074 [Erwinia phage pEa_SNUABM_22]YP_010299835.1 hypothetical protein MPK64_gp074 [Erwinia phage pEa_SNUABM_16]QZE58977.1 hypothetical protein pEaSNUABM18_00074 [Erwinia phage pEa_SNUABM_18]UAW96218.1 hypothetical protein pEaSNUABM16_00074 [Erwinia phage pEa_SNUABM_16]UAW96562.1 hypothetical protein pEaSNUABM22_00074 [Erwinia phage pEa_SNUABM_22]